MIEVLSTGVNGGGDVITQYTNLNVITPTTDATNTTNMATNNAKPNYDNGPNLLDEPYKWDQYYNANGGDINFLNLVPDQSEAEGNY